ncbi:unnamed protein product [Nesidiocoris tenuis]|uniref:Uncharacterized protein n=1 Tax=Nesidiocoris tenuis TaxID=355587 RepID=A0A6H5GMC9_9HEMI|nr:unnamed protein product [Nesidiocoris tenuis]
MTTGKVSSRTMPRIRSKRAEKRKFNEGIYQQEENAFSQVGLFLDDLGRPANNKKAQTSMKELPRRWARYKKSDAEEFNHLWKLTAPTRFRVNERLREEPRRTMTCSIPIRRMTTRMGIQYPEQGCTENLFKSKKINTIDRHPRKLPVRITNYSDIVFSNAEERYLHLGLVASEISFAWKPHLARFSFAYGACSEIDPEHPFITCSPEQSFSYFPCIPSVALRWWQVAKGLWPSICTPALEDNHIHANRRLRGLAGGHPRKWSKFDHNLIKLCQNLPDFAPTVAKFLKGNKNETGLNYDLADHPWTGSRAKADHRRRSVVINLKVVVNY